MLTTRSARLVLFGVAFASAFAFFFFSLRLAITGKFPAIMSGALVTASFLACVAATFSFARFGAAREGEPASRPLLRRHGFWIVALGALLFLPTLGTFGLTDPWETHYAEVAREMIERRDFISPWWGHEGFFMTKPVLIFWLEAISMLALGAHAAPDRVLSSGGAVLAHPEWAVRLPSFAFAILGAYFLYKGVARAAGRRAGAIGAMLLLTTPAWALIGHQAITDMPLVGSIAACVGLLLVALHADDAEELARIKLGRIELHLGHLVIAIVSAAMLVQIGYLVSRQIDFDASGIHFHEDRYFSGSTWSCTLPGQPACARATLAHPGLKPLAQALVWLAATLAFVMSAWPLSRVRSAAALGAWTFAAIGTMAKGPAGFAIPIAALGVYVVATGAWKKLRGLEPLTGVLGLFALVVPWYVAIYARHGRGFIDELVFRNMLGRTLDHLHDTNDGVDTGLHYYVWQLGYALFPWTGIAFASIVAWVRQGSRVTPRAGTKLLLFAWAVTSFALVSAMHTKFHHYMLPVVPPLAMLAGLWLDEIVPRLRDRNLVASAKSTAFYRVESPRAALLVGAACVTALVARDLVTSTGARDGSGQARLVQLFTYRYDRPWPTTLDHRVTFVVFAVLAVVALGSLVVVRARRAAMIGSFAVAATFAVFLLTIYLPECADHWGQRPVIDAYYRARGADGAPLVAYQMNWKGENYYTGNRVAIFVSSGAPMKTYLGERKKRGEGEVYFVTEHERVNNLRGELGEVRSFEQLTDRGLDRQFCLVRAVL